MTDFFVSYNKADAAWAEWIAWELEQAGHTVIIQAWDFRPGHNFVLEMHRAATDARQIVAVLSPEYLSSGFASSEWASAFAADPTGTQRRLIPVRVRPCAVGGILGQVTYIDLVDKSDSDARRALLDGVSPGRSKPSMSPTFPGLESAGKFRSPLALVVLG